MSDIERFFWASVVTPAAGGDWVRYTDHQAEVEQLTRQRSENFAEIERLTRTRDGLRDNLREAQAEVERLKNAIDHLTSERDEARAEAERRLGYMQLLAKQIDLWKAAFPGSTPEEMLSEQRFMDARINELRRERDGWRFDSERMTAERNEARREVKRVAQERDAAQAEVERLKNAIG